MRFDGNRQFEFTTLICTMAGEGLVSAARIPSSDLSIAGYVGLG